MNNIILEFLEAYKSLDALCKQTLASDRGISEYIDGMNNEMQGGLKVPHWKNDYKQLKRLRKIRNQLVHDTDSFQDISVTVEDVEWLYAFRLRILECSDPYSLLYQSRNTKHKPTKRGNYKETYCQTNESHHNLGLVIVALILMLIVFLIVSIVFLYSY